eukprot:6912512-Pyramimonas_sp.AAC.1
MKTTGARMRAMGIRMGRGATYLKSKPGGEQMPGGKDDAEDAGEDDDDDAGDEEVEETIWGGRRRRGGEGRECGRRAE